MHVNTCMYRHEETYTKRSYIYIYICVCVCERERERERGERDRKIEIDRYLLLYIHMYVNTCIYRHEETYSDHSRG